MPNNYTFLDSNSSVQTAATSIVSSAHQPIIQISSFLTAVPTTASGNQSVSGTVNTLPLGTIVTSVVSTVPSSVIVGASIFGQLPAGTAPIGSVAALQGTLPWAISGSVASYPLGTIVSSLVSTIPSSVIVGASIFGLPPVNVTNTNINVGGSVVAFQGSGWVESASVYGMRNDTIASFLGADLTERPIALDSAGRVLIKPFSAEESRVEGYASLVSTSQTTLVGAAGAGLRNYITDMWFANTDGTNGTLITLKDGAGSVLGYTIAPSKSGSNLPGMFMPIRTGANATFDFQPTTAVSILYATCKGYKAP